ncbi:MAG TPA: hypothetical protein VK144_03090 [Bacillota bacterium]|nr:hypothetical protein [Bacillota bacterium]
MTTFLWITLSFFIVAFIILFFFVRHGENQEKEPSSIGIILITAATLSIIVTIVFAGVMLVPMGAMFIAKRFFDFDTEISSIIFIGCVTVKYAIIFDHILQTSVQRMLQHKAIHHLAFNILRFFIFIGISSFVSLSMKASILFALVLTLLFVMIDLSDSEDRQRQQG